MIGARQFLMVALLAVGVMLAGTAAHADSTPSTTSSSSTTNPCAAYAGVTNRIVSCVRASITTVTASYFTQFYPLVSNIIGGTITLSVAVYGVLLAWGLVEKVGRDTILLLIKITLVGFFSMNANLMYSYVTAAMDSATYMIINAAPTTGQADDTKQFSGLTCLQAMTQASNNNGVPAGPWIAMDCLLDTVVGIKMPTNASSTSTNLGLNLEGQATAAYNKQLSGTGLQRGMIYFFFSGMSTSIVGLLLGILGFIFMWGLVVVIIKSLLTYISGYLGISILVIISPLVIPMVLFRETKQYFDKWARLMITFAMQPVLMMMFVILTISAVDLVLYSGDYSVMYRLAGAQSRNADFSINNYLGNAITSQPTDVVDVKTNPAILNTVQELGNAILNLSTSKCHQSSGTGNTTNTTNTADPACQGEMPLRVWHNKLDWTKLAALRTDPPVTPDSGTTPAQQIANEVLASTLLCGIVIFIMSKLMGVIPQMLSDLIGDLGQTPSVGQFATSQWNQGANKLSQGIGNSVQGALGSMNQAFSEMVDKRMTPPGDKP